MSRSYILLQSNYRTSRPKRRQRSGVVQKKPFDWRQFGRFLYRLLRYLLLIALLVAIFVGPYWGWQYLKENNLFFKIETVSVYGEIEHLPEERVNELVKDAIGQNLIGLDMKGYQDEILSESWIKSVSLKRNWFHELEVHIEEQAPVAIWNGVEMIDASGERFTPSFYPQGEWVFLAGPDSRALDVLEVYNRTKERLEGTGFQLSHLSLDESDSWSLVLDDQLLLIMGSENFDQRLERFLRQFSDREVLDRIQHIDFRYKNGFSVKWKENSDSIKNKL